MYLNPPDDEVEIYTTCYGADLLEREVVGERLSELIERFDDPLIIALEGKWGTGKTHFLKRWVGAHSQVHEGDAKTIYFDAFAHDYLSDPLLSLVAAVTERVAPEETGKARRAGLIAARLLKPITRAGVAVATAGVSEVGGALIDAAAASLSNDANNAIEGLWDQERQRKNLVEQFKDAIADLQKADSKDANLTKIVIVVDELDRCRPDYALQILEIAKHFFAIPHVHFVFGANMDILEQSVRARYGSEVDAHRYLQKFFNLRLSLPESFGFKGETSNILAYLQASAEARGIPDQWREDVKSHIIVISDAHSISLRDVERILARVSLLRKDTLVSDMLLGLREIIVTLIVSSVVAPSFYRAAVGRRLKEEDILNYFAATPQKMLRELSAGSYNDKFNYQTFWRAEMFQEIAGLPSSDPKGARELITRWDRGDVLIDMPAKMAQRHLDLLSEY